MATTESVWQIVYVTDTDPFSPTYNEQIPVYIYSPILGAPDPVSPSGAQAPSTRNDTLGNVQLPESTRLGTKVPTGVNPTNHDVHVRDGVRIQIDDFYEQERAAAIIDSWYGTPRYSLILRPGTISGWVGSEQARVEDDNYAKTNSSGGTYTDKLTLTNFDVSKLPDNAEIIGIAVRVKRRLV